VERLVSERGRHSSSCRIRNEVEMRLYSASFRKGGQFPISEIVTGKEKWGTRWPTGNEEK
jgi:hypothetical protein